MTEQSHKTPEQPKKYELTPKGLRQRLEDLGVDYLPYTRSSSFHKDAASLFLDTPRGERIWIEKSREGAQPKGHFFQDLYMSVHPGINPNFGARQIDFNFNEHGDGLLRKRVLSDNDNGVEEIPPNASSEGILHLAKLTLHHAQESHANLQLEEAMNVNNSPATVDEVAEAMHYLDGATVLDANHDFAPIAVVEAN